MLQRNPQHAVLMCSTIRKTKRQKNMIQRIQTLYMLLAAICCVVAVFFSPMQYVTEESLSEQQIYQFDLRHLHEVCYTPDGDLIHVPDRAVMNTWGLPAVLGTIALLSLVNIFLYRRRILQARLNIFTVCFCVGYYAMLVMYSWFACQRFGVTWYIDWSASMPLVALVLTMMATRRILQDEALVRAADRIR